MTCKRILLRRLWLVTLFFLFISSCSLTNDTLYQGHVLTARDRLVSENGRFTLGFSGSYLVLNYTATNQSMLIDHPLWLANSEDPVLEHFGVLTLDNGTGALKVVQNDTKQIKTLYAGSGSSRANNVTAILQNNGNFVLKEVNSGAILWQSFDDPTDTLLPGMKLGVNKRTGKKWLLRSWLNEYNPIPGGFTLEWDPIQRQIIVKRAGVEFWSSGVLTPDSRFDNFILLDSFNQNYNFTHISDEEEDYIFYTLISEELTPIDRRTYSRWFLDDLGNIQEDAGRPFTLSSEVCDGNSTEMGCKKWQFGPECRGDGDKFAVLAGSFRSMLKEYENLSFIDCQNLCWHNCDCTGFRFDSNSINFSYCALNDGPFYNQNLRAGELNRYIIIPGPPNKVDRTWIWIVTSIVIALIAAFMSTWLYLRWRRLKLEEKFLKELMTDDRARDIDELQNNGNRGYNLQIYDAATISAATNSFSSGNKLGEGGFGPVYKGRLSKGQEIAVKRLSSESGQGLVEFKNELILIAKLQHMNLVRLLGFCIQGEDKMLVYEYMPNKSLDFFIFGDESRREMLDWSKRLNIIDGIAQGLVYLHKYSRLRIVHRDLKASNILLDKDMVPKISDFGLARYFRQNEFEANTCTLVGTRGYMSPEYLMDGVFSVKSDVYSFGVLLLEIISGKKNHNTYHHDRPLNLVGYAWELWKDNCLLEILDPSLRNSASKDQVRRCINIGLLCVEQSPLDRPIMSDVLSMLTRDVQQLPTPKQPAFYIGEHVAAINQSERDMKFQSINYLSISGMDGR
ncbi:G-type lectin S-receptor-like serine/threonine-protein kinase CES101 [Mercurialis annua]|uniref:G-type lectin S-receptor-like serine/threonine-protein kinase CES101 n=1 Tax=Mercurialis annua TaxID=3986 RepID=UPI00215DE165|nr:G-type lectin S-receptor-like serine/threonine-protein kinase CES101 [Mercurialis annua]